MSASGQLRTHSSPNIQAGSVRRVNFPIWSYAKIFPLATLYHKRINFSAVYRVNQGSIYHPNKEAELFLLENFRPGCGDLGHSIWDSVRKNCQDLGDRRRILNLRHVSRFETKLSLCKFMQEAPDELARNGPWTEKPSADHELLNQIKSYNFFLQRRE